MEKTFYIKWVLLWEKSEAQTNSIDYSTKSSENHHENNRMGTIVRI